MKSEGKNKGCTFTFTMSMDIVSPSDGNIERISVMENIASGTSPTALRPKENNKMQKNKSKSTQQQQLLIGPPGSEGDIDNLRIKRRVSNNKLLLPAPE